MILIVDDRPDGAEALCMLISRRGFPCTWADNGVEALAMIRAYPTGRPLLVVLDEAMPGLSGLDVLRELRDDPATVDVAVIMFSAGLNLSRRVAAMALGVRLWLTKGDDPAHEAA